VWKYRWLSTKRLTHASQEGQLVRLSDVLRSPSRDKRQQHAGLETKKKRRQHHQRKRHRQWQRQRQIDSRPHVSQKMRNLQRECRDFRVAD
ncbi:hypothetical protein M5D96_010396, partial [Drosophila gunungcola]